MDSTFEPTEEPILEISLTRAQAATLYLISSSSKYYYQNEIEKISTRIKSILIDPHKVMNDPELGKELKELKDSLEMHELILYDLEYMMKEAEVIIRELEPPKDKPKIILP